MTRAALAAVALVVCGFSTPDEQQTPPLIFRAEADATSINVSVRDGNAPVAGLTANDFQVIDDGVLQTVSAVSLEAVPIDLTLAIDTSASVLGAAQAQLRRDIDDISGLLAPGDRLRMLWYATRVTEVIPMQPVGARLTELDVPAGGSTAFFNAIAAALLPAAEPGRPHLVVALGDGGDNISLLDGTDIRELARRSDAVLHVVIRTNGWSFGRGWLPFAPQMRDLDGLREAALATGGGFRQESLPKGSPATIAPAFARVIAEFKTSYVLWFKPTGVPASGWHDLVVRLKHGNYTVHARKGYFAK